MRTKLISLLVALCAAGNLLAADFKSGDLYYNITDDTNCTVAVTYQTWWSSDNYKGLTSVTIPATVTYDGTTYSVTGIDMHAFYGCTGLASITIPNSVTSIGVSAFNGCTGLTSITIPNSVTSIGGYAFEECRGITSITIPEGVTSIRDYVFYVCSGLTSITIPNSVTSIGNYAFYGCSGLNDIHVLAETPPEIGSETFTKVSKKIPVYIVCNAKYTYSRTNGWKDFTNYIELFEYELEVKPEDSLKGDVRITKAPSCEKGSSAIFEAVANKGYRFVRWNDGNTDNPRTVIVDKDTTFTAEFGVVCTISATCDLQRGIVTGGGTYDYGTQITLHAIPNSGYEFSQWSNGQTYNPNRFTALEDLTIEALFVPSTAVENVRSDSTLPQKVVRNGQVLIERGEKTYTTMGIEVE